HGSLKPERAPSSNFGANSFFEPTRPSNCRRGSKLASAGSGAFANSPGWATGRGGQSRTAPIGQNNRLKRLRAQPQLRGVSLDANKQYDDIYPQVLERQRSRAPRLG